MEDHDCFWANEVMWELCREAPDRAFRITRMLCDRTHDDWIFACIGAGPLEDLLSRHGETYIDPILEANRASRGLRRALMGVWTSTMRPAVRDKMDTFHATYGRL